MAEKLIHIYYSDHQDRKSIERYLASVKRLDELVTLEQTDILRRSVSRAFYVVENRIHFVPDWLDSLPPLVFPSDIPFNESNLLGAIFGLLGNEEKYRHYLKETPSLLSVFNLIQNLSGEEETDEVLEVILSRTEFDHAFENYAFNHNVAIALNYGHFSNEINHEATIAHYNDACHLAFEPAYKAFTLKFFATYLMDRGNAKAAIELLDQKTPVSLDDYAKFSLEKVWCHATISSLKFPVDDKIMGELKERLWNSLQFFDQHEHLAIAGFLWMDAAHVANLCKSYTESIGYISKAIKYFKEEGQLEMVAQSQMMKGRLLNDWAKSGNPQFYRSALESYQEAVFVFTKQLAPDVFATIHHQLGIIYAEIPDENKKRSIWAALSASSFKEALEYYTKTDHAYEYSMICNDYGNALTKYPQGSKSDNYERALTYYTESLAFLNSEKFPAERSRTLLNYIEASWNAGNPEGFNAVRFSDMQRKANEVKQLTNDEQLVAEADRHLQLMEELKKSFKQLADV